MNERIFGLLVARLLTNSRCVDLSQVATCRNKLQDPSVARGARLGQFAFKGNKC